MESNAPRLAVAGRVICGLLLLISIISWKMIPTDILSTDKRNILIYALIGISIVSLVISFWASRERKIPELNENPSVEQQFADLESTPTVVRSVSTSTDQFGLETVNNQTQSIIQSVIGTQNEPNAGEVNAAIDSLSKGEIGIYSAAEASSNPAPHKNATQVLDTVLVDKNEAHEKRTKIDNIPLPNKSVSSVPDLSWMESDATFTTEVAVKEIPLPEMNKEAETKEITLEELGLIELPNQGVQDETPELPELENLDVKSKKNLQPTPELPDIDNLF
ncbi:MAG: hypothetical protein DWB99_05165 [Candidatus Poseidoniales archaeon]|nr:MAG: hypothetical protein DWB99_05165 [Candidatus Poseidoniales archaeon]|tara:strand:- start:4818 stop:5648 length:831 start_codon:yes stop_codon:yes gene_type:complete